MGNCFGVSRKSASEIAPADVLKKYPAVKLYGNPNSVTTYYIRCALLYKPVTVNFIPSDAHQSPAVEYKSDSVTGSVDSVVRYLDLKFPEPKLLTGCIGGWYDETTPYVVWLVILQHRSMMWHLERMGRWAEDLAARGGKARGDPAMGTPRMEVRKFARGYSQLLELMLEHAQMEERVVFQILEKADRGLSKAANEEHARDLPMMNGIKEDIKSIGVLDSGHPAYQDALCNLSTRLKTLKEHSKKHFEEEEKNLLPLMEAAELSKAQQDKVLDQCLDVMHGTHSHLFRFFMEGLLPPDAMHYLDMLSRCSDQNRVSTMLRLIIDKTV
ncbi:hypothetical protein AABB24_018215 [Solanum stoloniferum]|uniref:Hemerythrin-like domain-containing protein n=2 Tax=Solanum TaxID=4107 RepID=A0AAF0UYK7_SOLVR|nr:uncharacterized protein LOC125835815 [Solanum verrucosum]WMV53661.1 hypothetical protein MTR67_047046 [Solanum verrucosum]